MTSGRGNTLRHLSPHHRGAGTPESIKPAGARQAWHRRPTHMKWWGWGDEQTEFDISDKPELWPFIRDSQSGSPERPTRTPPVSVRRHRPPAARTSAAFRASHPCNARRRTPLPTDKRERLVHAYGKSFRDLWRIRRAMSMRRRTGDVPGDRRPRWRALVAAGRGPRRGTDPLRRRLQHRGLCRGCS